MAATLASRRFRPDPVESRPGQEPIEWQTRSQRVVASSPAEAVAKADIALSSLADDEAVRSVYLGERRCRSKVCDRVWW